MARPLRGLRHQASGLQVARPSRAHPRLVSVMSWSTFGIALVVLVGLLGAGRALPPAPGFLVFVALLALSTNHDVVFPSEYAASADLAVVLAAVVAFRHDAALIAPLLLGLLTGPLDVVQWRRRAFVRMAWNSGDRALAGLAAAGALAAVVHVAGESVVATVGAALVAAGAATLVDTALSFVLVTALGNTLRVGWRTVVDIDVLQFPLLCAGAAVGFLVTAVGAWAAVAPMLALVLLPELVQARSRVPAVLVRDALLVLEVGVACLVVAPFVAVPDARTICLLLAVAVLVGAELVVDARVRVPAVLGVVVVVAAIGASSAAGANDDGAFAGILVGAGATAAAWCCTRAGGRGRAPVAVAIAALGGGLAGALVDEVAAIDLVALALAASAVLLFALVVITGAGAMDARGEGMRLVWAFPLGALGVGAAVLTAAADGWARAVPGALLGIGALAAAWCGATPWRSRVLSRRLGAVGGRGRAAVFQAGAVAALAATGVAFLVDGDGRVAAAVVVIGAGDIVAAMALAATRQWRFAPRARARDATFLVAAAALFALAGVGAATAEWWSAPAVAVAVAIMMVIGRDAVARSDELGAQPRLEIRR